MVPTRSLSMVGRVLLAVLFAGGLDACSGGDQGPDGSVADAQDGTDGSGEGSDSADGDAGDGDGGPDGPTTPVPDSEHTGWKQTQCGNCHELPQPGHLVDRVPECAGCHGGNGACDPDGSGRPHRRGDPCLGCHGMGGHGFVQDDCTYCHFADQGVVTCP